MVCERGNRWSGGGVGVQCGCQARPDAGRACLRGLLKGNAMVAVISVIGWHNSGKTTFLVRLIQELGARGVRVATVKHTQAPFHVDHEGTDTWRFAQAGSEIVAITSSSGFALMESRRRELTLEEIIERLPRDVDLVVTEGFKREPTPKIEVIRAEFGAERIASEAELLAIVSDTECASDAVPCFGICDAAGVVDLLQAKGYIQ